MLKTLKWVYDLGVRQERTRIASYLQLEAQRAGIQRDTALDMLRERADSKKPFSKERKAKLDFSIAVNDRVADIIHTMFMGEQHYEMGASFMYPEDERK